MDNLSKLTHDALLAFVSCILTFAALTSVHAQPSEGGAKCISRNANPNTGYQFEFKFYRDARGELRGRKIGNPDTRFPDNGLEMIGLGYGEYEARNIPYSSFGTLHQRIKFDSSGYVIRRFMGTTLFQEEQGRCDYERANPSEPRYLFEGTSR